jgi:membrane dipeptidase
MRIVDLHSHYPMHVLAGDPDASQHAGTVDLMTKRGGDGLYDSFQRAVLRAACKAANYEDHDNTPSVTADNLIASPIRVALSVLYDPFDEIRFDQAPPRAEYLDDLMDQIDIVEKHVAALNQKIVVAKSPAALQAAIASGDVALIHAVEGGFHLGAEPDINPNVARLARKGVAYITVSHLFYRAVAKNSPGLPFLPDWIYHALFHQPNEGLTSYGKTLIKSMVANGILIDLTHMSRDAMDATLDLLDTIDPARQVPVLASHGACDGLAKAEYNLRDKHIRRIAERRGVIGLIASAHWMARGRKAPKTADDTAALTIEHIERIQEVTKDIPGRQPYESIGIGSDQDGFIKPAMEGLATPAGYAHIITGLQNHFHDDTIVERICWGNALDVLLRGWKGATTPQG